MPRPFAPELTPAQQSLLEQAEALAKVFEGRIAAHEAAGTFPFENYADLARAGLLALNVPAIYGGGGQGLFEATLVANALGRGCASTALVLAMHYVQIGRWELSTGRPEADYAAVCRAAVEGRGLLNSSATEDKTGSPFRGGQMDTVAERHNGGWRLNGRKTFTTGAPILAYATVRARLAEEPESPPADFLVRLDQPGVRIEETWNLEAMALTASHDLVLTDVKLPPTARWSQGGAGMRLAGIWNLPTIAVYLGIAEAAAEDAVTFARNRRPPSLHGGTVAEVPHILDKLGQIEVRLAQARGLLYAFARRAEDARQAELRGHLTVLPPEPAWMAAMKYTVINNAIAAVELAMRVVGSRSLARDHPLRRRYLDVRAGLNHPPQDDAAIDLLARRLLNEH